MWGLVFRHAFCAGASGALFALAAPPFDLYASLWLGMAGLAFLVGEERAARPGWLGVWFGVGANVVALRFVPSVVATFTTFSVGTGVVALLLLSLEQSLRWAVAAWASARLTRLGVPLGLAFGAGVFAGTFVPAVFPWTAAGGVTPVPAMVQLAEVIGERGVTFVMALSAGLLADAALACRLRRWRPAAWRALASAAIPLGTYALGRVRIDEVLAERAAAPTATVALVDPATDPHDRWIPEEAPRILARLAGATELAERRDRAELTVWPEAAYPYPVAHESRRCPIGPFAMLPFGVRGPVLTGLVTTGNGGDLHNSAAVCLTNGALSEPQDKLHLLWFGETIPWLDRLPWVRAKFTRGIGLVAGDRVVVQRAGTVRASVLNCFEDTLPGAGREAMEPRPNLLVNVTNDGWFAGSTESELHMRLAALRAIESRRDLVRAVNEGVTGWIDAAGIVRARVSGKGPHAVVTEPALLEAGPTLFDRFGDWPLAALLMATVAVRSRRRPDSLADEME